MKGSFHNPEAQLVLRSARVELDDAAREELRRALQQHPDWEAVCAYSSHNGVLPLVWKHLAACGLEHVPAEVAIRFQQESRRIALYNMRQALALVQLVRALEEAVIPVIPFKGPVLAETAYGDTSYRSSIDLDLLVHRSDFERAASVLEDLGYVPLNEQHTPAQRADFIESTGGYDFGNYVMEVQVELHWKFFPAFNAFHFDLDALWKRHQRIQFANTEVRALAPEDLFLYLCIHGTKHRWTKLKWVCDVAAYLRVHPELDWAETLQRAERLGVLRMVRLALLLARELMGAALPDAVDAWSTRDRMASRLARQVYEGLVLAPPGAPPAGSDFWFHFRERERWRDRVPYALHTLRLAVAPSEKDRAFVRLPDALAVLYLILRPIRIAFESMRPSDS